MTVVAVLRRIARVVHSLRRRRKGSKRGTDTDPATMSSGDPQPHRNAPKKKLSTPTECDYYVGVPDRRARSNPCTCSGLNALPPTPPGHTRFVFISDTHELHEKLLLPDGDVLVHCGDILITDRWTWRVLSWIRMRRFFRWFNAHPHRHKIVMGGNHDAVLGRLPTEEIKRAAAPALYLEEEAASVAGFRLYASPRSVGSSPNKAFQGRRYWQAAPPAPDDDEDVDARGNTPLPAPPAAYDLLLTHGTPEGGMKHLVAAVAPRLAHFCGHGHADHGVCFPYGGPHRDLPSINVSILRGPFGGEWLQNPTVVDLPTPQT